MKLWTALLVIPCALAWTPPIFMDTMESEPLNQENQESQHEILTTFSLRRLQLNGNGNNPNQPTASPTESPAPSPSPSAFPTSHPTGTPKPTGTPTLTPTESPAPSPSPSKTPTFEPTAGPTGTPSSSPTVSLFPTIFPTVSHSPTAGPTASPTSKPSASPSTSPSASPTLVSDQQSSHMIKFDLPNPLAIAQARAFEVATKAFVTAFPIPEGFVSDVTCDMFNQIVRTDPATGSAQQTVNRYLEIHFVIHVKYTGKDSNFDLFDLLNPQFQNMNSHWIRGLADENTVFQSLVTESMNQVGNQRGRADDRIDDGRTSMSKKSYTSILLVSFLALILAIVASVYAIRSHNLSTWGTELRSPTGKPGLATNSTHETEVKVGESSSSEESGVPPPYYPGTLPPPPQPHHQKRSMEGVHRQRMSSKRSSMHSTTQEHSSRQSGNMAPPSPPPPPPRNLRKERDPVAHRVSELPEPPAFSEVNFDRNSSLFDRQSIASDASSESESESTVPHGRFSNVMAERIAKFEKSSDVPNDGQEMLLTKSFGGTLGAKSVSVPGSSSDVSSQAKAFFENLVKKTSEQINGTGAATGRPPISGMQRSEQPQRAPMVPPMTHAQPNNRRASYESILRKPGLYDVFAPPGPIGLVVDTTDDGPAVHSLKNTSPMIGLIAPGDLIVGLDDQDTRGMTAATLTRLMAQKANQKERKITLLTMDE